MEYWKLLVCGILEVLAVLLVDGILHRIPDGILDLGELGS